jgi:hypothetical protein
MKHKVLCIIWPHVYVDTLDLKLDTTRSHAAITKETEPNWNMCEPMAWGMCEPIAWGMCEPMA